MRMDSSQLAPIPKPPTGLHSLLNFRRHTCVGEVGVGGVADVAPRNAAGSLVAEDGLGDLQDVANDVVDDADGTSESLASQQHQQQRPKELPSSSSATRATSATAPFSTEAV